LTYKENDIDFHPAILLSRRKR